MKTYNDIDIPWNPDKRHVEIPLIPINTVTKNVDFDQKCEDLRKHQRFLEDKIERIEKRFVVFWVMQKLSIDVLAMRDSKGIRKTRKE